MDNRQTDDGQPLHIVFWTNKDDDDDDYDYDDDLATNMSLSTFTNCWKYSVKADYKTELRLTH